MNILTFDIEDWYHILDNTSTKSEVEWSRFEPRIFEGVDRILDLLAENNQSATFFCLGWIAKKHPEIIKKIHEAGHEIGTHSYAHQLVYQQNIRSFKHDLSLSIKVLEDITGKGIDFYRAPGFSINQDCLWAFDALAEHGIKVDCSLFPAKRSHGGISKLPFKTPFIIKASDFEIMEFPMSTFGNNLLNIPYSGGGYFRLLPYRLIKKIAENSSYFMTYFHPRDFDVDQPIIPGLSSFRKFKAYYGLDSSFKKLRDLLEDFDFIPLSVAIESIDWNKVQKVEIDGLRHWETF